MTSFFQGWQANEAASKDVITTKRIYIDINDGLLTDGVLFGQIMYWHSNAKNSDQTRLRVKKNGHYWLVKSYADWFDECRVNEHTARKALKRIADRGLIVMERYRFNGSPTMHIRINEAVFEAAVKSKWQNESDGTVQIGQNDVTESSRTLTETTSENTTETIAPDKADAAKPEKPKKDTTPKAQMTAMKDAIVEAYGWQPETVSVWGEIQRAAKLLIAAGAKPEDMKRIHAYCSRHFETFGPMAFPKWWPSVQLQTPQAAGNVKVEPPKPSDALEGVVSYGGGT